MVPSLFFATPGEGNQKHRGPDAGEGRGGAADQRGRLSPRPRVRAGGEIRGRRHPRQRGRKDKMKWDERTTRHVKSDKAFRLIQCVQFEVLGGLNSVGRAQAIFVYLPM